MFESPEKVISAWTSSTHPAPVTGTSKILHFLFIFLFIFYLFLTFYLFLRQRETEHERGRGGERGRHRIGSRLQALSHQPRARRRAWTHGPRDRDLSWSRTLNRLTHPGTPKLVNLREFNIHWGWVWGAYVEGGLYLAELLWFGMCWCYTVLTYSVSKWNWKTAWGYHFI